MSEDYIWADGFVVVEAVENQYGVVNTAKFVKVTNRFPAMDGSQRAIRLRMRLPKSAFDAIANVSVRVPEQALLEPEIEVVTPG